MEKNGGREGDRKGVETYKAFDVSKKDGGRNWGIANGSPSLCFENGNERNGR